MAVFLNLLNRWESAELNQAEAAELLGVSERTFRRWTRAYEDVITAGGVASGIDFALHIATEIVDEETAQAIQLGIEYDPAPPFTSGHPDRAPASVTALVAPLYVKRREAYRAVLQP
jgi:transcriptional regulator GlxA family with amidase domain